MDTENKSQSQSPDKPAAAPPPRPILQSFFYVLAVIVVVLVLAVLIVPNLFRPNFGGAQASAVGSLRTINTAEITYASTYDKGFSSTLAVLAPDATGANPTAEAAGLIDSELASGVKIGYRFVYTPGPRDKSGKIATYSITASPLNSSAGTNYYYTDQTGVIRQNATATAGSTDSPLAG